MSLRDGEKTAEELQEKLRERECIDTADASGCEVRIKFSFGASQREIIETIDWLKENYPTAEYRGGSVSHWYEVK